MTTITVAKGDGIGPEIMDATLHILKEAGAQIEIEEIEVGEKVYLSGNTSGIAEDILKGSNYHATRWRLQKLECNYKKIPWTIFKCPTMHEFASICQHETSGDGHSHHKRK